MSSLVLRSLLLPENNQVQSITEKVKLKGIPFDNTQESVSGLSRLDSLRLSGFTTQSTKGRVPIQLMQPDEINTDSTPSAPKNTKPKTSGSSRLAALTGLTTSSKPLQELRPIENSINYNITSTISSSYSSVTGSKQVIGNLSSIVTSSISFVDETDKTGAKMAFAIAKIEDWDRKIGALDAVLEEQKNSKTDMSSLVITGSQRLTTARTEAAEARKDAIVSFNEAVKLMNEETKSTGMRSPLFNEYKNTRDQMEKMFNVTMEKDKTTMEKVMDYLKITLTPENLNKTLHFINPLSDKY